ncbi:hypothetical protein H9P43_001938 [Blastocladiella emersonii ATCC 22665]|nr:hypothetical protein H9P43_001938 [Blastocladiella emersonii ATCC 22665]
MPPAATTIAFGVVDPILFVSRLSALITCLPSLMTNLNTINCVWQRYAGRGVQKAIILSCMVAAIIDLGFLYCVCSWLFYSGAWFPWGPLTVCLNVIKRINSAVVVLMVFLRATALLRSLRSLKRFQYWYMAGYLLIGGVSSFCHLHAYIAGDWVSKSAYYQATYKFYRVSDVVAVAYYALPALATDVSFITLAATNPQIASRFKAIRPFYNAKQFVIYELIMLVVVLVPLFLGISDPLYGSAPYNEAFLLALVCQNASYSVRAAASVVSGDSSGSTTGNGPSTAGQNRMISAPVSQVSRSQSQNGLPAKAYLAYAGSVPPYGSQRSLQATHNNARSDLGGSDVSLRYAQASVTPPSVDRHYGQPPRQHPLQLPPAVVQQQWHESSSNVTKFKHDRVLLHARLADLISAIRKVASSAGQDSTDGVAAERIQPLFESVETALHQLASHLAERYNGA